MHWEDESMARGTTDSNLYGKQWYVRCIDIGFAMTFAGGADNKRKARKKMREQTAHVINTWATAGAIFFLAAVSPLQAQSATNAQEEAAQPTEKTATHQLSEIVVTARKYERSFFETPQSVTIIDQDELHRKLPGRVSDALRDKPGIWSADSGTQSAGPIIRGFVGNRVLYNFDGVRVNTASIFPGPNGFLNTVDFLDVDRIEVIRGPGSVFYGSDAIGGVVNVETKQDPIFSDTWDVGGREVVRYGSAREDIAGRQECYISSPDLYMMGGAMWHGAGDLRTGEGAPSRTLEPTDFEEWSIDAQVAYRPSGDQMIEFFAQDYQLEEGHLVSRPTWNEGPDRNIILGLQYTAQDVGFAEELKGEIYYRQQTRFIDEKYWDKDADDRTHGFELQARTPLYDTLDVTYGVHYHRDSLFSKDPQKGTQVPDGTWDNPAAYALLAWRPTDRLLVEIGGRYDYMHLKADAPSADRLGSAFQAALDSGQFAIDDLNYDEEYDSVVGGLGLAYEVVDNVNLCGYVGTGFRAPSLNDVHGSGPFTSGFAAPSLGLEPEYSTTWEIGPKFDFEDWGGYLTYFQTRITDMIDSQPGTFGGYSYIDLNDNGVEDFDEHVYVKQNVAEASSQGVELETYWHLPQSLNEASGIPGRFSLFGNFAWIDGENEETGEPLDRGIGGLFPANAILGVRWQDNLDPEIRKWFVEFQAGMADKFTEIAEDDKDDAAFMNDVQDPANSSLLRDDNSIPGYTIYDLYGGWNITKNTAITVGIENITDKRYRLAGERAEGGGRNLVASLDIRW